MASTAAMSSSAFSVAAALQFYLMAFSRSSISGSSGIPVVENVESLIKAQLDMKMLAYKEDLENATKEDCSAAATENADEDIAAVEAIKQLAQQTLIHHHHSKLENS